MPVPHRRRSSPEDEPLGYAGGTMLPPMPPRGMYPWLAAHPTPPHPSMMPSYPYAPPMAYPTQLMYPSAYPMYAGPMPVMAPTYDPAGVPRSAPSHTSAHRMDSVL